MNWQTFLNNVLLSCIGANLLMVAAMSMRPVFSTDSVMRYRFMVAVTVCIVVLMSVSVGISESQFAPIGQLAAEPSAVSGLVPITFSLAEPETGTEPSPTAGQPQRTEILTSWLKVSQWPLIALGAYGIGICVFAIQRILRWFSAIAILRNAVPVAPHQLPGTISGVPVLVSTKVHCPCCIGAIWPRIVLPADWHTLPANLLTAALAHERVHAERRDGLTEITTGWISALNWFSPICWWFAAATRIDREISCDAIAVRNSNAKSIDLAEAILQFCRRAPAPSTATNAFNSYRRTKRRIEMLTQANVRLRWIQKTTITLTAMTVILFVATVQWTIADQVGQSSRAQRETDQQNELRYPMQVEFHANPAGREDERVLQKYRTFFQPSPAGSQWLTDQETACSADEATIHRPANGDERNFTMRASTIRINLPEGSKLKAQLRGDEVTMHPRDEMTIAEIRGGELRIVDAEGVVRFCARTRDRDKRQRMKVQVTYELDEVCFLLTGFPTAKQPGLIEVSCDLATNIPADEAQPPHGAVRYELLPNDFANGPFKIKMQWIYDISELSIAE